MKPITSSTSPTARKPPASASTPKPAANSTASSALQHQLTNPATTLSSKNSTQSKKESTRKNRSSLHRQRQPHSNKRSRRICIKTDSYLFPFFPKLHLRYRFLEHLPADTSKFERQPFLSVYLEVFLQREN